MTRAVASPSSQHGERRSVRFECIDGLSRTMIPLACDVWLAELARARWASLEMIKLGNAIVRYMISNRSGDSLLKRLECDYQLSKDDTTRCLYVMRSYGAVASFTVDAEPQIVLALSGLQRLQVLQAVSGTRTLHRELGLDPAKGLRGRCRLKAIG